MARESKDGLFCHLFSQERYLLELYRTLHPEDAGACADDLELVTIQRVVTEGEYNDLGFTVGGRLMVLVEAQTKWSPNIVTRMMLYVGETYRRYLERVGASLHDSRVVPMPVPELYVVYTGSRDVPDEVSFVRDVLGGSAGAIEVTARVLRGGGDDVVGQYVECAHVIDEVRALDIPATEKARRLADTCIERGILAEYFEDLCAEVTDIMFTLFDQERETRLYHERLAKRATEEGLEKGLEQGLEQGREQGLEQGRIAAFAQAARNLMAAQGLAADQAMDLLGIPADDRPAVAAQL